MTLSIFEFMEASLERIRKNNFFIEYAAKQSMHFFKKLLKNDEHFLNIVYRIKSEDSIKEKMLRQNYFSRCPNPDDVMHFFGDLIGLRIECRFNEDEKRIFELLQTAFSVKDPETGYSRSPENDHIFLNLQDSQPQMQKNGFEIYKIDGRYIDANDIKVNFEVQIKSMVNLFWGEIDHRMLYKNFTYMLTEDFIRDIMYSIKNNLQTIDRQLSSLYKRLKDMESSTWETTKLQLKAIVSKVIHDVYTVKLMDQTGLVMDLRNMSNLVTDYIFAQILLDPSVGFEEAVISLMNRVNTMPEKHTKFGDRIRIEPNYSNVRSAQFGKALLTRANVDFRWNLCLNIIFDISEKEAGTEFANFVDYILYTIQYRIRKAIMALALSEEDHENLIDQITDITLDFFIADFDMNIFTLNGMRGLQNAVSEFFSFIERPEDLLSVDIDDFKEKLVQLYHA